jgi:hypothetical protein
MLLKSAATITASSMLWPASDIHWRLKDLKKNYGAITDANELLV